MKYAQIRSMDISNGEGIGVALFVQGCPIHCYNCFNIETWDFEGGKDWTKEVERRFIKLADKPYINRISILGGEPLAEQNMESVHSLVHKLRILYPQKTIWLYTGYKWEDIFTQTDLGETSEKLSIHLERKRIMRSQIISECSVLVDGPYIESQSDIRLKWRGSSNQRVIDIKNTIKEGRIVLFED